MVTIFYSRTKHTEFYVHFTRAKVVNGEMEVVDIPTKQDKMANTYIKSLAIERFKDLTSNLVILPTITRLKGLKMKKHRTCIST